MAGKARIEVGREVERRSESIGATFFLKKLTRGVAALRRRVTAGWSKVIPSRTLRQERTWIRERYRITREGEREKTVASDRASWLHRVIADATAERFMGKPRLRGKREDVLTT